MDLKKVENMSSRIILMQKCQLIINFCMYLELITVLSCVNHISYNITKPFPATNSRKMLKRWIQIYVKN